MPENVISVRDQIARAEASGPSTAPEPYAAETPNGACGAGGVGDGM